MTLITTPGHRAGVAVARRYLLAAFAALFACFLVVDDAEARRFGGGKSFGFNRGGNVMNRQATPPSAPAQNASQAAAAPGQPAAPQRSPWMGVLGGLALGAGLGALLGHLGLGSGLGGILLLVLLAAAAFFVVRLISRGRAGAQPLQYAGSAPAPRAAEPVLRPLSAGPVAAPAGAAEATGSIPAGFDVAAFVRQAKLNFVRLQAANDAGNMEDIRVFTTPELFAEIQLQYQERGRAEQKTDILELEAELLDVATEGGRQIASVRFSGRIREAEESEAQQFAEVWHLARPADGSSGWVIAGIQQYDQ